jgi:hypothetical protein
MTRRPYTLMAFAASVVSVALVVSSTPSGNYETKYIDP